MAYETRAYDQAENDPVVVLVATGTNDVSHLVNVLRGGHPGVEHVELSEEIRRQVRRHNGGRAALAQLKAHGGPDFTDTAEEALDGAVLAGLMIAAETLLVDCATIGKPTPQHQRAMRAALNAVEQRFFDDVDVEAAAADRSQQPGAVKA